MQPLVETLNHAATIWLPITVHVTWQASLLAALLFAMWSSAISDEQSIFRICGQLGLDDFSTQ